MEQLDWMRILWSQMTTSRFSLDDYEVFLKIHPVLLVTDCNSPYDVLRKEGAGPSSTDKRFAIDVTIVKSRATECEADLRWIDARYPHREHLERYCNK